MSIPPALPSNPPFVTLSFFRYKGWQQLWGLAQMQLARRPVSASPGLRFFKLLGSGGGNGFSLRPNFSVYGLLAVWEDQATARQFIEHSAAFSRFRRHAVETWTVYLRPAVAQGDWSGQNPFLPLSPMPPAGPLAVLTRATIHTRHLLDFWRHVPGASAGLEDNPGLRFAAGVGELPVVQQATFSLWESQEAMRAYAYRSAAHRQAIKLTRERGWYREELFAQFVPLATDGTWHGTDPLAGLELAETIRR